MTAVVTEKQHLPFLVLGNYHLSPKKARLRLLNSWPVRTTVSRWRLGAGAGDDQKGREIVTMTFPQMVEEAQRSGIVHHCQSARKTSQPSAGENQPF